MNTKTQDPVEAAFAQAVRAALAGQESQDLFARFAQAAVDAGETLYDYGVLMRNLGQLEPAQRLLEAALKARPDHLEARYELGLVLLGQGDYPGGWPLYEVRRALPQLRIVTPQFPFPEWRGEPLDGKRIVLFPEQGLGDNIQFARFALTLRDQGAAVVMLCRPGLQDLLVHNLAGVEVLTAEGSVELGEPDYWAHFASLPGSLGLTLARIPAKPYLAAPTTLERPPGARFRIGLATQGSRVHPNDARRSLDADQARRLAGLPGQVVSLHPEETGARDFAQTAAIIDTLDLVVTVDTSVAHLAGAMGKPTFILVPGFGADWRWLQGRSDSPWYPSVTLFRGRVDGDWSGALDQLEAAVARRARAAA